MASSVQKYQQVVFAVALDDAGQKQTEVSETLNALTLRSCNVLHIVLFFVKKKVWFSHQ